MMNIEALASAICVIAEECGVPRWSVVQALKDEEVINFQQYSDINEFLNL